MGIDQYEGSRHHGKPTTLYEFNTALETTPTATRLESAIRSVTMIPGTTEFGYGTTKVTKTPSGDTENSYAQKITTDFVASLDQLIDLVPNLNHVSLVVAWHGDDLRCGVCQIKPRVETADKDTQPYAWRVGETTRAGATVVSYIDGKPAIGGAPADRSVFEAITELKDRGLKVTLYPFLIMDIEEGNSLSNPYTGSTGQPLYPWRGRITCNPAPGVGGTVDKTATAATQVHQFFGECDANDFAWNSGELRVAYSGPSEWGFRKFILHLATIAQAAGGVDDFLLGSELVGLTSVRSSASNYPATAELIDLAGEVASLLPGSRLSYAADWSEYHSHRPTDGSNDVYFPLDALWADANIDFVAIDNYLPIADWRNGTAHQDFQDGFESIYDLEYLQHYIEGGEFFDWYYANQTGRDGQDRLPITDGGAGKPWVFRNKDIHSWWDNAHVPRPGGVESGTTPWVARSKPVVFTELGCPAVDKGPNQPNVFVDPKSSESFLPHYSTGNRDDAAQRAFLEAHLDYWNPANGHNPDSDNYVGTMLENDRTTIWTWDARPYPYFPLLDDVWGDAGNWSLGHWLTGRLKKSTPYAGGPWLYTDAETPLVFESGTYDPIPIDRGNVTSSGNLDKADMEINLSRKADIAIALNQYPLSSVITLIVRQGHIDDPDNDFPVVWTGRVINVSRLKATTKLVCEPIATAMRRPGLRRRWQIGCPHVLYGDQCKANRQRATISVPVVSVAGSTITLPTGWSGTINATKYVNGIASWVGDDGLFEQRTILRVTGSTVVLLSGPVRGIGDTSTVDMTLGCNHQMDDCLELHDNIHNHGGCPFIPKKNPSKSQIFI
jgi:hypothetical protein